VGIEEQLRNKWGSGRLAASSLVPGGGMALHISTAEADALADLVEAARRLIRVPLDGDTDRAELVRKSFDIADTIARLDALSGPGEENAG
jgi:hypothetical protein